MDIGKAEGLIGSDTLREFVETNPARPCFQPSEKVFTGIDSLPSPGLGGALLELGIPGLEANFSEDVIGGPGSFCPVLMPLGSYIRNKMGILCGFFENRGSLLCIPHGGSHLGYRSSYAESRHYLFLTDDCSTKTITKKHASLNMLAARNARGYGARTEV